MVHDFKKFPELTNGQLAIYYFQSPHKQIVESFRAKVVKVTDGDTVRVETYFRDFDFPIRIANIAAPELNEGGHASKYWLKDRIEGKEVYVVIDKANRVGRYGRLIGEIILGGLSIGEQSIIMGQAVPFEERDSGIPSLEGTIRGAFK